MSEHDLQRQLIEALGLPDEHTISLRKDMALRLRELAALNAAKLCLRRHYAKVGMSAKAVEMTVKELRAPEYQVA